MVTDASTAASPHRCKACDTIKARSDFYAKSLERSFYTCKKCSHARATEYRRTDPATRLAARIRVREKRGGIPMRLCVAEIRRLLATEDQNYVREDLVSLEKLRPGEALCAGNVTTVRLGRLLSKEGSRASAVEGGGHGRRGRGDID